MILEDALGTLNVLVLAARCGWSVTQPRSEALEAYQAMPGVRNLTQATLAATKR
jgi:hypothetical protein